MAQGRKTTGAEDVQYARQDDLNTLRWMVQILFGLMLSVLVFMVAVFALATQFLVHIQQANTAILDRLHQHELNTEIHGPKTP